MGSNNRNRSSANEADLDPAFDRLGPTTELDRLVLSIIDEEVTVRSNGESKRSSLRELLIRMLSEAVLKDKSAHGRGQLLKLLRTAEAKEARDLEAEIELAKNWKAMQWAKIKKAEALGKETRSILPHPDDIIIDRKKGWKVEGPTNEEELREIERKLEIAEVWYIQSFLDDRLDWPDPEPSDRFDRDDLTGGSASSISIFIEQGLPERFRPDPLEKCRLSLALCCATKRELLKEAHQAWRSIGMKRPRGWRSPPQWVFLEILYRIPAFALETAPFVKAQDQDGIERQVRHFVDQMNETLARGRQIMKRFEKGLDQPGKCLATSSTSHDLHIPTGTISQSP